LTFIGSAIGPVQRSLVPVFVDIDPVTFNIDPAAARAAITPRTKAIVAVHLHGLPCDWPSCVPCATSTACVWWRTRRRRTVPVSGPPRRRVG
jgi:dTDP-4-amino-4,6-dideoxygalactose transaminase